MPEAKPKTGGVKSVFTRKVGPVPVWGWVVALVVVYLGYKKLSGGGSSGGAADTTGGLGATQSTQAQPQSATSAASDAAGVSNSALANILGFEDNLNSNLVGGILNSQNAMVDINSNLVGGLINSQNAIIGLGETALGYNGQLEQAIIDSYHPTAPATTQSPSSSAPASSSQTSQPAAYVAPGSLSGAFTGSSVPMPPISPGSLANAFTGSTTVKYAPLLHSTMIGTGY